MAPSLRGPAFGDLDDHRVKAGLIMRLAAAWITKTAASLVIDERWVEDLSWRGPQGVRVVA
jgi:hypothetical protein